MLANRHARLVLLRPCFTVLNSSPNYICTGFVRNCFPWTAKVPLSPRSSSCSSPREKPQECDSSSPWLPMVRADREAAAATIGVDLPTYNVLVDLQHRDITPEDYETLRHLDRTVKPKTLSLATLNARCPCVPVTSEAVSESDTCSICLESFSVGQHTRRLPCSHVFHANCIDEWLSGSSNLCPEDGQLKPMRCATTHALRLSPPCAAVPSTLTLCPWSSLTPALTPSTPCLLHRFASVS